ncbi:MAG: hypothetical protein WAX02_13335 [Methanothrix sp.]|jgi:hypothetical protein|nr:hypothetical protein [Methanothrix soehngenii]
MGVKFVNYLDTNQTAFLFMQVQSFGYRPGNRENIVIARRVMLDGDGPGKA